MTQKTTILKYLMRRPKKGMTNGDAMRILYINCPHKRVAELTADGIRINREQIPVPGKKGYTMTRYWLADPAQEEIKEYLTRHGA